MISEIKRYMKEHVIATKDQIKAETNMSDHEIEQAVEYLISKKYLAIRKKSSQSGCSSCSHSKGCSAGHEPTASLEYLEYIK